MRRNERDDHSGSGLAFLLFAAVGAVLGELILPGVAEIAPGRGAIVGGIIGVVIWLVLAARG